MINIRPVMTLNYAAVPERTYDAGLSIKGTVKKVGLAIPCRVRLIKRANGALIDEVLTDAVGNYSFNHLANLEYCVMAHDPARQYNAVVQDLVRPV